MKKLCLVILAIASTAQAGPLRYPNDAALRAVQFIDANEGWAVGDEGVIWHTIDGGKHWDRQPSGVTGSLRAVQFLTPYTGWIVGREQVAANISVGIVLATTDGGLTWRRLAANTIPGLHTVKFFDDQNGIAAGECCELYPTGVFVTADGGKTWRAFSGPRQPGWVAGDFSDLQTGALGGVWSSLGVLNKSVAGTSEHANFAGRSVKSLKIAGQRAIAVGEGGLLLTSSDSAGTKWGYRSTRLHKAIPEEALGDCDFNSVAILGEHVWIAGRPGSFVLHSGDYGQTWELFHTGQSLPLYSLFFHDAKIGWAVGELGTILGTIDGGKTWTALRRGGMRAAALFVHSRPEKSPLDLIALLGGEDNYRVVALCTLAADPVNASFEHASDAHRWSEIVRRLGGVSGEMLRHVDAKAGKTAKQWLRDLVLTIRIWQPEIILSDGKNDSVTAEAVQKAYLAAGDAKLFPDQTATLGLTAWTAKKHIQESHEAKEGRLATVPVSEPLPRLGRSPRDAAGEINLLMPVPAGYPNERRLIGINTTLMEGITLAPGGTARREFAAITETEGKNFEERVKALQLKRNLEAMVNSEFAGIGGPDKVIGQLDSALKKMPADIAAEAAFAIANQFVQSGQWHLAREAFFLLLDRYPNDPHCLEALRWLVRYSASSEARRRSELGQFRVAGDSDIKQASGSNSGDVKQAADTLLAEKQDARRWYYATIALEPYLARHGLLAAHDPAMQFCIGAARRSLADPAKARQWIDQFLALTASPTERLTRTDPWRDAASAEVWLSHRKSKSPRPAGECKATTAKPYLNGKLDDDCWKDGSEMPLQNALGEFGADYPAKARFAYDEEYLYIAVECKHPASQFAAKVEKRGRDMDLASYDRVSIMLDMDRDFQTYYRFQIDQRGALAEDCWGDPTWNPRWFVAVASDESGWTAEVAIPKAELTGERLTAGKVWACNVVRVVPSRGVQSWSQPADEKPRPEGMGLLLFGEAKK